MRKREGERIKLERKREGETQIRRGRERGRDGERWSRRERYYIPICDRRWEKIA